MKRDVKLACNFFILAANAGQPKAFYQLAKMFHTGVGLKKNLPMVSPVRYIFLFLVLPNIHYLWYSIIFLSLLVAIS